MKLSLFTPVLVLTLWFNSSIGFAQSPDLPFVHLKVGVVNIPPFGFIHNGKESGIAVDIWNKLAKENNFDTQFVDCKEDGNAAVEKVQEGELDIAIGPIGLLSTRAMQIDFSVPYYQNNWVVLAKTINVPFWTRFNGVFKGFSLQAVLLIFVLYLLYMHLFLFCERHYQPDLKDLSYRSAMETLLWRSLLGRFQSAPYFPSTRAVKVVSIIWSVVCSVYIFSIFAGLTATMVTGFFNDNKPIKQLSDLSGKPVASPGGQAGVDAAIRLGINVFANPKTMDEAVSLLDNGKVEAIFTFKPWATTYLQNKNRKDLYLSSAKLPILSVGFVVNRKNIDLLRKINISILKMTEEGEKALICIKYEGLGASTHCS